MKKWSSVVAVLILCLSLIVGVACGGEGEEEEEEIKEVKFGVGLPLSGIYGAAIGMSAREGYELAADYIGEFTVAGERYKWNLIFEENHWSSQGGVASATKLVFEDGVKIMTQMGGDAALAALTICEESEVLLFTIGVPADVSGPDMRHAFQPEPGPFTNAAALFKYIIEAHPEVKTASAIPDDTATGRMLAEAAATAAEYYGIEWLDPEYFPPETVEFYPVATNMMSKDPDICYMDIRVITPMRELGWEGISFFGLWATTYGEGTGWENFQGHLHHYPGPHGEGVPEPIREMAAEYQQRFGVEFTQLPLYSIVQLYYLTDALKKAGTVDDVDQIIATLETETFDTPVGPVRFGLREVDGIGHQCLWPCWIGEIRGEEYHRVLELSIDEAEALVNEIWGQ